MNASGFCFQEAMHNGFKRQYSAGESMELLL